MPQSQNQQMEQDEQDELLRRRLEERARQETEPEESGKALLKRPQVRAYVNKGPVSYTHLDVYKRQAAERFPDRKWLRWPEKTAETRPGSEDMESRQEERGTAHTWRKACLLYTSRCV